MGHEGGRRPAVYRGGLAFPVFPQQLINLKIQDSFLFKERNNNIIQMVIRKGEIPKLLSFFVFYVKPVAADARGDEKLSRLRRGGMAGSQPFFVFNFLPSFQDETVDTAAF